MCVFSPLGNINSYRDRDILRMDCLLIDGYDCFNILWGDGIFDVINTTCGSLIDEHEEERLTPSQINKTIEALNKMDRHLLHAYTQLFIDQLIPLLVSAKDRDVSVHFIL